MAAPATGTEELSCYLRNPEVGAHLPQETAEVDTEDTEGVRTVHTVA